MKCRNLPLQPTKKTLSDLRFALRGGNFDQTEFLSSMEAIDGIVIDLGLDWEILAVSWSKYTNFLTKYLRSDIKWLFEHKEESIK